MLGYKTISVKRVKRGIAKIAIYLFFSGLIVFFSCLSDRFLTVRNIENILIQSSIFAIASVGEAFVILARGIDISVGPMLYLAGVMGALSYLYGAPPLVVVLVIVGTGVMAGMFNGLLLTKLKIGPLITTLATYGIFRGVALNTQYQTRHGGWRDLVVPDSFRFLGSGRLGFIPVPILMTLLMYLIGYFILTQTSFGRKIYFVGNAPENAKTAGINLNKTLFFVYLICGFCVGVAALAWSAQFMKITAGMGKEMEIWVIAAAVLGGVSLAGGEGNLFGAWFGTLIVVIIINGLNILGASPYIYGIVNGLIIFIAILSDTFRHR